MKDDEIEKLIEKYKDGNTTLSEEQLLFDDAKALNPSLQAWSTFVKNNKIETPNNFNDDLWKAFQNRKNRKRKITFGMMSAAASIVLLLSIFTGVTKDKAQSYTEKEALLNEAIEMVSNYDSEVNQQHIIFENDMVIIYSTTD